MSKEYEIVIKKDKVELTLETDSRTEARNVKKCAVANDCECAVTRTAKREVKFAGI